MGRVGHPDPPSIFIGIDGFNHFRAETAADRTRVLTEILRVAQRMSELSGRPFAG